MLVEGSSQKKTGSIVTKDTIATREEVKEAMVSVRGCDVGFHRFFWGVLISNAITADLTVVDSKKAYF